MKQLKVGIAGYGVVGNRRKEYIDLNPNLKIIAVCDQKFTPEDNIVDGILCFPDYHALLENDLDIIFVCMSNDMAAEVTIAALKTGKHVFCEKPPARSLDEMDKVIAVEEANPHLKLMYGFNHRYHDSVKDALKIMESNTLGKVINIKGVYGKAKLITFNQPDWRTKREISGGGVLLELSHEIDYANWFFGPFLRVQAVLKNSGTLDIDVEDTADLILTNNKGMNVVIHLDFCSRCSIRKCKLYGSKATMNLDFLDKKIEIVDSEQKTLLFNKEDDLENMFVNQLTYFLKGVFHEDLIKNNVDDSIETLKIIESARLSNQLNKVVEI